METVSSNLLHVHVAQILTLCRFCVEGLGKHKPEDARETLRSITVGIFSAFLLWKLNLRYGIGEKDTGVKRRKLRGIKQASSLDTFRKNFLRVYRNVVGEDMDSNMVRESLKVGSYCFIQAFRRSSRSCQVANKLAQEKELSRVPREKPTMDANDVLEIMQTTLTTVEKMFGTGRYRIQTCFFIQGGFITANRPEALLQLRYRDIKIKILRNPEGGPHNVLLEWTYEFTKSFMGPKAP
jgi:hypothetical protein